jgi:uncharacterized membrane protein YGL010W
MSPFDLRAGLDDFATWHTHPGNRACHDLGIPLVTLPVLGALSWVPVGPLDLALVLLAGTFVFDLLLAWQLAPGVLGVGLLLWAVGRALPGSMLGLIFLVGWGFQLAGHRLVERNAPAFTDNLLHLVVGPRWLVNRWLRLLPHGIPPEDPR